MSQSIQQPAQSASARSQKRGFWTRELYRWHWISSALSLIGLLLFAITGVTLNHAGDIAGSPKIANSGMTIDGPALAAIQLKVPEGTKQALPAATSKSIHQQLGLDLSDTIAEWTEFELFLAMPRPGGDATMTVDRETGEVRLQNTDYGWIAYFNDLHKGRNTGSAWSWFIDLFAAACLIFSITGLILLQLNARSRPSTWPLVGFGLLLPALLILLFVHR